MKKNPKTFKEYLAEIEDPNYQGGSWALPEKPTLLEKTKYEICQKILSYKQKKHLSTQKLAQQINLTLAETEDIFFSRIEKFTLDRLVIYAANLGINLQMTETNNSSLITPHLFASARNNNKSRKSLKL